LARNVPGAALLGEAALLAGAFGAAHLVADRAWARPLREIGRRSLPVYLVHLYPVTLLVLAARAVPALHGTPARGVPLVLLVTTLALAASLLVARVLAGLRLLKPPAALLRRRGADAPLEQLPLVPPPAPRATAAAGAGTSDPQPE